MCGLARYRRLLSQEASLKYFLLGILLGVLPLRDGTAVRLRRDIEGITGIAAAKAGGSDNTTLALLGTAW